MENRKNRTWLAVRYIALNAPIAVLAWWLPYKDGQPVVGVLWALAVMLGDPGTPLMVVPRKEEAS